MMLHRATKFVASAAALALLVWSTPAWAPFHIVVIDQIFFGTADCPNAQYVMLRTLAPGQVLVAGQTLPTQNADGSAAGVFGAFDHILDNGQQGVAMLIGTADAQALFGIAPDQVVDGQLQFPDGRVCFGLFAGKPVDCVAYGSYSGDTGTFGSPAVAPQLGMALVRQENTSNNANDFALGAPAPRNNAGATGTLGQCSGAAPTPTATTSEPTPTATPPPVSGCPGDCDETGTVTVGEIVTAVNIALGNATVSQCEAVDTNGSHAVEINELVAAVNALLNGCPAG